MSDNARKRRQLTVSEKLTFIDKIDSGKKMAAVAREFGISSSTASGIYKEKSKIKHIRDYFNLAPHRKRVRLGSYYDVDEAVFLWYRQMRSQNKPVNGPMLQQKAREFAKKLGRENFEGSSGWLYRFRERHDMSVESMRADNKDGAMTSIGMTDDEIVSTVTYNMGAQPEYIVSNVDLSDIYDDSGTELPTYYADIDAEEKPITANGISPSEDKDFCDADLEVEVRHTTANGTSVKENENLCSAEVEEKSGTSNRIPSNENKNSCDADQEVKDHPMIVNGISSIQNENFCDITNEVVESQLQSAKSPLKLSEAISLMKKLTAFFEQQTDIPKNVWESLNVVNNFMRGDLTERFSQRRITEYFK